MVILVILDIEVVISFFEILLDQVIVFWVLFEFNKLIEMQVFVEVVLFEFGSFKVGYMKLFLVMVKVFVFGVFVWEDDKDIIFEVIFIVVNDEYLGFS